MTYYVFIVLEGVYIFICTCLSWKLYIIRDELKPKFLDETKALLMYHFLCFCPPIRFFYFPFPLFPFTSFPSPFSSNLALFLIVHRYSILSMLEWIWTNVLYLIMIATDSYTLLSLCILYSPYISLLSIYLFIPLIKYGIYLWRSAINIFDIYILKWKDFSESLAK